MFGLARSRIYNYFFYCVRVSSRIVFLGLADRQVILRRCAGVQMLWFFLSLFFILTANGRRGRGSPFNRLGNMETILSRVGCVRPYSVIPCVGPKD